MMKLQTHAALAAGIALTGVAFVLAIGAFDTACGCACGRCRCRPSHDAAATSNLTQGYGDARVPDQRLRGLKLGRKLFFDARIPVDGTVSCARCHQPSQMRCAPPPRPAPPMARMACRRRAAPMTR